MKMPLFAQDLDGNWFVLPPYKVENGVPTWDVCLCNGCVDAANDLTSEININHPEKWATVRALGKIRHKLRRTSDGITIRWSLFGGH